MTSVTASFSFPTETIFGAHSLIELPKRLHQFGSHRPLVVTDSGLVNTSSFQKFKKAMEGGDGPIKYELYSGVQPNPTEENVIEAGKVCRQAHCDLVIGLGGGSALDVAKA